MKTQSSDTENDTPTQNPDSTYNALGLFHKISQLRADSWCSLKENLATLTSDNNSCQRTEETLAVKTTLSHLEAIEKYSAFPPKKAFNYFWELFNADNYLQLDKSVSRVIRSLQSEAYRRHNIDLCEYDAEAEFFESSDALKRLKNGDSNSGKPYFELLIVDSMSVDEEEAIRYAFHKLRSPDDNFIYDIVTVPSFEDAIIAILTNPNIQACMIRFGFPYKSKTFHGDNLLRHYLKDTNRHQIESRVESERSLALGSIIRELRPELDLYLVASRGAEKTASKGMTQFTRIFYRETAHIEQHHIILNDIYNRYQTPFFDALKEYSKKPTGVFHALPLSRGKSITKAHWIDDMMDFYGRNLFLAETSTTSSGLDSLLQPTGVLKNLKNLRLEPLVPDKHFLLQMERQQPTKLSSRL